MPVWRLDRPLTYSVPEKLSHRIAVGSIVRVALRARRVRGWVVSRWEGEAGEDTQPLLAVSGRGPVFDGELLEAARISARRYLHPLASFLRLMTPPRLGRARDGLRPQSSARAEGTRLVLNRTAPGEDPLPFYESFIAEELAAERSVIVCVPEVREGSRVMEALIESFPDQAAAVHSGLEPSERSEQMWSAISGIKRLVIGGRAASLVPAPRLGLMIVHSEHDRGFKEQRSPYYDARMVAMSRAQVSDATVILSSPTPTPATLAAASLGWEVREPDRASVRQVWPATELVDPVGHGVPRRVVAAVLDAVRRGRRTLVLLPRAHPTPSGWGPEEIARYLERVVPEASVTRGDREALGPEPGKLAGALEGQVVVATEAALAEIERPPVHLGVGLGVDAMLSRPAGRAVEDCFETLWALGAMVAEAGPGGRLILETGQTSHHAVQGIVRGDYSFYVRKELESRREFRYPPYASLVRLRAPGFDEEVLARFRGLPGCEVLGPVPREAREGEEILLKAVDLERTLDPLRDILAESRVSISAEVDPRDW